MEAYDPSDFEPPNDWKPAPPLKITGGDIPLSPVDDATVRRVDRQAEILILQIIVWQYVTVIDFPPYLLNRIVALCESLIL